MTNVFFNSVSVVLKFLMNWASNIALVLFNIRRHHLTGPPYGFSIFTSFKYLRMYAPGSFPFTTKYSWMDQIKFVEDSL